MNGGIEICTSAIGLLSHTLMIVLMIERSLTPSHYLLTTHMSALRFRA